VSLLIGDLAYGAGAIAADHVKVAVLCGSLLSAVLASVVLTVRNRAYRRITAREQVDDDGDGIPDVYQER
jgi:Na+:H+ antiporter, NhaA family